METLSLCLGVGTILFDALAVLPYAESSIARSTVRACGLICDGIAGQRFASLGTGVEAAESVRLIIREEV